MCKNAIWFSRLFGLIGEVNDTYPTMTQSDIKAAVYEVIDTYTFFEDAYDKVQEWSGPRGELQRLIVNDYTKVIPTVMREVILVTCIWNTYNKY